jgi:hypothetical protein
MPDFLDRLGDQLRVAHAAQSVKPKRRPGMLARAGLWPRLGRRGVLASLTVLALAAPALAVVQPWSPILSRPGVDGPVASDSSPVVTTARGALAVLRREQTSADRTLAEPRVKAIGMGNQVDGVQTASIRALVDGWVLVPAKKVTTGPGQTDSDELCITNGQTVGCSTSSSFVENGVGVLSASKTDTSIAGLVPDDVARVRFTPDTGTPVTVDVESNFYSLSVPETAPSAPVKAPDGSTMIPGPPMPVAGTLDWLDINGHIVGPARQRLR